MHHQWVGNHTFGLFEIELIWTAKVLSPDFSNKGEVFVCASG